MLIVNIGSAKKMLVTITSTQALKELKGCKHVLFLVLREFEEQPVHIPSIIQPLIEQYQDISLDEISTKLPHSRNFNIR